MILSCKFCVFFFKASFQSDKASFCKIQTRYKLKFTLKFLSEVLFINFVCFVLCCMLSYQNFPISSFMIYGKPPF